MPTEVLRPNSESDWRAMYPDYAPSDDVVSDEDGDTKVTFDPNVSDLGGQAYVHWGLSSYTLQADERCKRLLAVWSISGLTQIFDIRGYYCYLEVDGEYELNIFSTYIGPFGLRHIEFGSWSYSPPNGDEWDQDAIDDLKLYVVGAVAARYWIDEISVALDIVNKPVMSTVPAPTGAQSTRKPLVTWTRDMKNGENQAAFEIKIFDEDTYNGGGFDPDTSTPVHTVLKRGTGNPTSHTLTEGLADGTYKAYVRVAKDFRYAADYWWSEWMASPAFTITDPPVTPTLVTPVDGATVNTSRPAVGAKITAPALLARSLVEWELATDLAFTTALRNVIEDDEDLLLSGVTSETLDADEELVQGLWYMHARTISEYGAESSWSAAQSFTVTHPPAAVPLSPADGLVMAWPTYGASATPGPSATPMMDWNFTDTFEEDSQTAYQLIIEVNEDATSVYDSGKVASTDTFALGEVTDEAYKDVLLRWKVRLWDQDDVVGPYSDWETFYLTDAPSAVLVVPIPDEVIDNPAPTIEWLFVSTARIQEKYRAVIYADDTTKVVYDSDWLPGTSMTHSLTAPVLENSTAYYAQVSVIDDGALPAETDLTAFTTEWTPPDTPIMLVDTDPFDSDGYINFTWTDDERDGNFDRYDLYRRAALGPSATAGWELVYTTSEELEEYEFHEFTAGSGVDYEYMLAQVAVRFDVEVTSEADIHEVNAISTHYWLVHPTDESLSVGLFQVVSDSLADEYESETLHVLGQGIHADVGDRLGYNGSLTAELWDREGLTAREQREAIEALKASRSSVYLRNPFGDVFLCTLGDVQFDRMAGVGTREFGSVTIPYTELEGA